MRLHMLVLAVVRENEHLPVGCGMNILLSRVLSETYCDRSLGQGGVIRHVTEPTSFWGKKIMTT
jgi:hypothetical protein